LIASLLFLLSRSLSFRSLVWLARLWVWELGGGRRCSQVTSGLECMVLGRWLMRRLNLARYGTSALLVADIVFDIVFDIALVVSAVSYVGRDAH